MNYSSKRRFKWVLLVLWFFMPLLFLLRRWTKSVLVARILRCPSILFSFVVLMKVPLCFTNVLSVGRCCCLSFLLDTPTLLITNQVYLSNISFSLFCLVATNTGIQQQEVSTVKVIGGRWLQILFLIHSTQPDQTHALVLQLPLIYQLTNANHIEIC